MTEKKPEGDGNFKFLFSSSPTQLSGSNWVDNHLHIATAWRDRHFGYLLLRQPESKNQPLKVSVTMQGPT